MSSVKNYYSVDNMKKIMTVFEDFLTDKYNTNSTVLNINLKKEIFHIMERLKENPYHKSLTATELNKITLQTLRDIIKTKYLNNVNNKIINKENYLERDAKLYNDRKTNYIANENFNENTQLDEETNNEILTQFNKLNEERKEKKKEDVQKENKLEGDNIDQSMSQEDFKNNLEQLQEQRNKLINEQLEQLNMNNMDKSNEPETNYKTQLMLSTTDFMNERNQLMQAQFSDISKIDPKTIYSQSEKIKDIEKNEIVNKPVHHISPSFPLIKPKNTSQIIKEKYVCINSMDRDWINQPNRYQYLVKFNYVHKGTKQEEIRTNNTTIPNTKSALSSGIPNYTGFIYNNNYYSPYTGDPLTGTSSGDIIGFETVEFLVDDNINVQQNFKNIQSIEISKVIVPADIVNAPTGRLYNFNLNYPYVLLQIDEFQDIYEGTDDSIRKSFCQLIYENFYQSSNGRGYIVLKPVQNEKKVFYPSLLSSMPSLNISLRNPNGDLLNESTDGYSIIQITYEPFNRTYLKITTTKYFDKNEFYAGDKIFIKNYCAYKINIEQDETVLNMLNSFINRDSGHDICKIGDASENSYYRSFYIKAPGTFYEETGIFDVGDIESPTNPIKNLSLFNCNNDSRSLNINGFVLNMSLQNSISMKITTVNIESSQLIPEMLN